MRVCLEGSHEKKPALKKNLIFFQKKAFFIFLEIEPWTFRPRNPKFFPKKISYIFPKNPALKKVVIYSQKCP